MKKIFTLAAAFAVTATLAAQTESWSVADAEGNLQAAYVANPDPSMASVVAFETENVQGTHVSGPVAGYKDAEELPLVVDYNNSWSNLNKKTDIENGVFYYVQGKGNPVANLDSIKFVHPNETSPIFRAFWDDAYYQPDGSLGLPVNGTFVTLLTKKDGELCVPVWINKGSREVFVVKATDAKALTPGTEVKYSGYVNGQKTEDGSVLKYQDSIPSKGENLLEPYIVGGGNQAAWAYLTFNATAGETYYIFNKNTQIGFGGFTFTPSSSSAIDVIAADNEADAAAYNLMGQPVDPAAKGIIIRNGKKYINR